MKNIKISQELYAIAKELSGTSYQNDSRFKTSKKKYTDRIFYDTNGDALLPGATVKFSGPYGPTAKIESIKVNSSQVPSFAIWTKIGRIFLKQEQLRVVKKSEEYE